MYPTRRFTFSCLALIAIAAFSGQAFATYAQVGSCTPPNAVTPAHTYTTIQTAVTSSAVGTIIQICPGTYPEQIVIGKKITLLGVGSTPTNPAQNAAVILPPTSGMVQNAVSLDGPSPIAAQILVQNTFAALVTLTNLTVDGIGNQISGCGPDFMGILFQNSSGTLNHLAVRNQIPGDVLSGCQSGESIFVQTSGDNTSKVLVENSSVHNYNKNGITGNDTGTVLKLTENFIQGSGPDPNAPAQNGIQIGFGATGSVVSETVIDNVYFDPNVAAATDVLLFDAAENSGITVNTNVLGNSQIPIALETQGGLGDGVTVNGNHIFGTDTYDAIDVCTNGNTITKNLITNSDQAAIDLDSACGGTGKNNTATGNTIIESKCAGFIDDWSGTGGNTYAGTNNTYYTVPYPITGSAGVCPFVPGDNLRSGVGNEARSKTKAKAKVAQKYIPKR
jgi:hypothetical protein